MIDDYANRQAAHERDYVASFDCPEYLRWVDRLSAEERQHAESLGLLKPMIDRSGSTSRDEDACLSSVATDTMDTSASDDPPAAPEAAPSPLASETEERLWDILRRLLGELLNQTNAKLSLDCLAIASGMGFLGDSMTEIAKRNGVTRAAVSKRCVELTQKLKLDPSRAMRSLTARTSYAHTQHLIHRNNEQRNRESR